ncbi:unnamed protein product, partial [Discosporangium mesarthrocarpum]
GPSVTGSDQVRRCLTLLGQDEGAAEGFYSRLHLHVGVPCAAKVVAMLVKCALVSIKVAERGVGDGGDGAGGVGAGAGADAGMGRGKGEGKGKEEGRKRK